MPAGNSESDHLTPEARKHLLLVACTLDRFEFGLGRRRAPAPVQALETLARLPWLDLAASVAARVLPRRLRYFVSLGRLVRRAFDRG